MILIAISAALAFCAAVPALLFVVNLRRFNTPRGALHKLPKIAVLIPARNEEKNIGACLQRVLQSTGVQLEVKVLDDGSEDKTAEVVRALEGQDARVQLIQGESLPEGWNGKQHACWLLAQSAEAPLLCFLDADVRLAPNALARCATELQTQRVSLLSGFPRQVTEGWMERMLLPLIHFVLLGFLPMGRMRRTTKVGYAAGCGQFFLADRTDYFVCGGHCAVRETRHDGLKLPQIFRRHGFRTDLVDLTELASVRMYESASAVWMGLAKNATEGLGAPVRIVPLTAILLLGQVLPVIAAVMWLCFWISNLLVGATFDNPQQAAIITLLLIAALVASYLPRLLAVSRFRQPIGSALLHPLGISLLLAIQWYALARQSFGRPVTWRTRLYSAQTGAQVAEPRSDLPA